MENKRKITIFDTTLRDGEQSPGAAMTVDQKIEMAIALDKLGIDRIEAGFPVSSPVQFSAVQRIGQAVKTATVTGLARCTVKDIDAVRDALKDCPRRMIHVFIATSPLHMKHKLKMTKDEVLNSITKHVSYAREQGFDLVEFSPEDASRTEWEFLLKALQTAVDAGANTLNIPDTVGYAMPDEYGARIAAIKEAIPELGKSVLLSTHCHNDLGLALANSLAAVKAGADQVEVTLNGIGERAGNASLEELVMALKVRLDLWNIETNINHKQLYPASKLLQNITGLMISRNKPIFGDNVFSHESGIHQHGVIRHRETYEIMDPEDIGRSRDSLVLGRHSGKAALKEKLDRYSISLNDEQYGQLYEKFIIIADRKKEVYDEDLLPLVADILSTSTAAGWHLDNFQTLTGNGLIPTATVKMSKNDECKQVAKDGDGPVDAIFKAIDQCVGISGRLTEYRIQAVGSGQDAQGQVNLQVDINGKLVNGRASSTDIIEASALAYINAVNRLELMPETRENLEISP
ncbi:MAG: 2-isopropylmalate synthase [Spirochaeta sp. LUC14_002_19_P3]|nr:MAG: 2-isopropylmalate synthase [Spirochaeta sp. LUC14_002_19_P3]